ncbi:MAG TPA: outer membrane beta-barrel protein, partial [Croceibacterium sp.]
MRKAFTGLVLATSMLATTAIARDDQMYGGVEGGVLFPGGLDVDFDADGDDDIDDSERNLIVADTDMGWDVDGILGYDFGGFRLEGELGYKTADVDRVDAPGFDLNPATPAVESGFDVDGNLGIMSAMVNGLVDLGPDDGAQFYAGGGLGWAWVDLEGDAVGGPAPFVDDSDNSWAWQAIAGMRFPVSDNVDLGLKYRFFNIENLNMVSPGDDRFETDFSSHSVLASLVFNFGGSAPPPPPPPRAAPPPPTPAPPPPPPPQTRSCPDGSTVLVTAACPVPPAPVVPPTG